jgi:hypothetical protein
VHRLSSLIVTYPPFFTDLNSARMFIQGVCYASRFQYTGHPDVEPYKFRTFVNFTTAKYAFQAGKFKLDDEAEEARRQGVGKMVGGEETGTAGENKVVRRRPIFITKFLDDQTAHQDLRLHAWKVFGKEDREKIGLEEKVGEEQDTPKTEPSSSSPASTSGNAFPGDLLDEGGENADMRSEAACEDGGTAVEEKRDPFKVRCVHSVRCSS